MQRITFGNFNRVIEGLKSKLRTEVNACIRIGIDRLLDDIVSSKIDFDKKNKAMVVDVDKNHLQMALKVLGL